MHVRTYRFKLYKSKRNRKLHKQINTAGLIYNHCIALHKRYYKLFGKSLNLYQLQKHITKLKKISKFAYMKELGSQAVQDIAERIDRAYKLFFRNLKHKIRTAPPSFKKINKYKIQTITVKRDALGDIYLYFVCETSENEVLARTGKNVGFDFGLKTFLTASDGKDIKAPLFFRQNANAIKMANRDLSRKAKGSNNRKKAKIALARLHKKVANQRDNFHWQTASKLVGEYALICIEDLNLKTMQKRFGRKISDLGFADFVSKLKYKAHRAGASVVEVDRFFPSSQLCSDCGYQNTETKNLTIRKWTCPKCGNIHNRDRNASINIEREGSRIFFA